MAKVQKPNGFVEVLPGKRGKAPRDLASMLVGLKSTGDEIEILKTDGSRYGSAVTARNVVNSLIPLAEKQGFALREVWTLVNAKTGETALCIERVAIGHKEALKYRPLKPATA